MDIPKLNPFVSANQASSTNSLIETLPQEILYKVCDYLDHSSLAALQKADRFFGYTVHDYRTGIKVLDFSRYPSIKISQIQSTFSFSEPNKHLTKLILRGCKNITDEALWKLSIFRNIEEIDLIDCDITGQALLLLTNYPHLNSLKFGYIKGKYMMNAKCKNLAGGLKNLTLLKSLRLLTVKPLDNRAKSTQTTLLGVVSQLQELRKLSLTSDGICRISLSFLKGLSFLETLALKKYFIKANDHELLLFSNQSLPNLRSINMAGSEMTFSPPALLTLLNQYQSIENVIKSFLNNLTQLPKLQSLNLSHWDLLPDSLKTLTQSPSLTSLNLSRCVHFGWFKDWTEKEINIIKNLKGLKSLDISHSLIKYELLLSLCDLEKLVYLNLEGCNKLKFPFCKNQETQKYNLERHAAIIACLKNGTLKLKSLFEGNEVTQRANNYLLSQNLILKDASGDGNCFFHSFLGAYNELRAKNLIHIPLLEEAEDKIQFLREQISSAIKQKKPQRAEEIKTQNAWVAVNEKGSILATILDIPIRAITVQGNNSQLLGILDELYFNANSQSAKKGINFKNWENLSSEEKPEFYICIVDLSGPSRHFMYGVKKDAASLA